MQRLVAKNVGERSWEEDIYERDIQSSLDREIQW